MKLLVPNICVPATGEKTLRQYKCATVSSESINADLFVAVTNRRIIQHADEAGTSKSKMLHNEIYLDNIGGISYRRGVKIKKIGIKLLVLFLIFAAIGGVLFWQAAPIFDFIQRSIPTINYDIVFKLCLTAIPLVIFLIVALVIYSKSKKFSMDMIIYTKGLVPETIIKSSQGTESSKMLIIPYLKETQTMISEISSIILDVQKFGPDEVLRHIDPEEETL